MYEVFFNDRKIMVARPDNTPFVKEAVITKHLLSAEEVKDWFMNFTVSKDKLVVLLHPSPEIFWKEMFLPLFITIPAAGGVVIRDDKLLFIFRNGKWDLPKGKIDAGEDKQTAALREVAEECGIFGHRITKELPSSFHIFLSPYKSTLGKWILKETFWFEMSYKGIENGTPETDENITEIRWFAKNELHNVLSNTYENLKSVFLPYLD